MERQQILKDFINQRKKEKPGFPENYCNPASHELMKILADNGIETKKCFSYKTPWDWHTFLRDTEWIIIDPTYEQFDNNYTEWYIWIEFPDEDLKNNEISWEEYKELQLKWFQEGVYNNQNPEKK